MFAETMPGMTDLPSASAELWLVRHGETEWSRTGRHTSRTEVPLTEVGEEAARRLAPRLAGVDFDLVLTSPRLRARRTAALAGYAEAVIDGDLAEWDYGDYEGLTSAEIQRTVPDWTIWTRPCPDGESADQIAARLDRVVDRVLGTGGRVLAFGHGHAGRALAMRWLGLSVTAGRFFLLDPATVSVLGHEHGGPAVARWNS
jgi:probable phosphoglycerate mutase